MVTLDEQPIAPEMLAGSAPADDAAGGPETPMNEIVETARRAKDGKSQADKIDNRNSWIAAGVGVGIGSAALVAALLYANRDRGGAKKE